MSNNPIHDAIDHINYLDSLPNEVVSKCSCCDKEIVFSEKNCLTNSEGDVFCGDCSSQNKHLEFIRDKYSYLEDSQILEIMDSIIDFKTK